MPSTSQTFEPSPWLTQTGRGREIIQLDVAPPASTCFACAVRAADAGWRARNTRSSCSMRSSSDIEPSLGRPKLRRRNPRGISEECHRNQPLVARFAQSAGFTTHQSKLTDASV